MANSFYTHGTVPQTSSDVRSFPMRTEFDNITLAFSKFPALTLANAGKVLVVNSTSDAVTLTTGTLDLAGNFATTGAFNTTFAQQASVSLTLPAISGALHTNTSVRRGRLNGMEMSNAADTINDITISAGTCASTATLEKDLVLITLLTSITKQIDATWVVGTNVGGRPSTVSLSVATQYHLFVALLSDGTVDAAFDNDSGGSHVTSVSGKTVTAKRRIGSVMRNSAGNLTGFVQKGDYFYQTATTTKTAITQTDNVAINISSFSLNNACRLPISSSGVSLPEINILWGFHLADTTPAATAYVNPTPRAGMTNGAASETTAKIMIGTGKERQFSQFFFPMRGSGNSGGNVRMTSTTFDTLTQIGLMWVDHRDRF